MYEGEDRKEDREKALDTDLKKLLMQEDDELYSDVTITFTLEEDSKEYLKNIPVVRILR